MTGRPSIPDWSNNKNHTPKGERSLIEKAGRDLSMRDQILQKKQRLGQVRPTGLVVHHSQFHHNRTDNDLVTFVDGNPALVID